MSQNTTVVIVGAGMSGSFTAICLAQKGFSVEVYERRQDIRHSVTESGASINMTLSRHGMSALADVGLLDSIMPLTTRLKGRMIHTQDGKRLFQPYGKNEQEVIYSIKRHDFNIALLNAAQAYSNIRFHFNHCCLRLDKYTGQIHFLNEEVYKTCTVNADFIIGADGVFSVVRQQMHHRERAYYQQEFMDWGYKELSIQPVSNGVYALENEVFHMWPRGDRMLMAVPNQDGSFTCTCVLPFQGAYSFATLQSEQDILAFFKTQFDDILAYLPNLLNDFQQKPIGDFITLYTHPWYYQDRIVLIGDASHSFVPFYGQGMNASLADCIILRDCLAQFKEERVRAFATYQQLRKRHTDAMADLSKQNFVEICDKVRSPLFVLYKNMDVLLNKLFPKIWIPLYSLIMYTDIPYADAIERVKKQAHILKWLIVTLLLVGASILIIMLLHFSRGYGGLQAFITASWAFIVRKDIMNER